MNDKELIGKVHNSMYHQIQKTGYATPVQVLVDLSILSKEDLERWRFGKIDYLERVCKINLSKLSKVMKEVSHYGRKNNLKESVTFYKQWGKNKERKTIKLRFSKYGKEEIEKIYSDLSLVKEFLYFSIGTWIEKYVKETPHKNQVAYATHWVKKKEETI